MALDKFKDECGVFAIYGHPEAANFTYLGLYALQHRGQESAGIVSSDGIRHHVEVGMGHVSKIFKKDRIDRLKGHMALGHNRYSTSGESLLQNAQPMAINYSHGPLALAHNGNLINADEMRDKLEKEGSIFRSTNDSEVIIHLIAKSKEVRLQDRVTEALGQVKGAFSLAIMSQNELIVSRDPRGFKPLAIGKLGNAYIIASETCAFHLLDAEFLREVEPGELLVINEDGLTSYFPFEKAPSKKHCVFEFIYFSRPDSSIFGKNVHLVRKEFGRRLAQEAPADVDYVVPVPDSGIVAGLGFAEESGIPYERAIIRNHYVGRTFIEPTQSIRHFGVKIKLNPIREVIEGKRIVLVDDSIVRGTTSKKMVKMVRDAGAKEVHMRISSPPTSYSCFYGIDTPARSELIAATYSVEQIAEYIGADSLGYLSMTGMLDTIKGKEKDFCTACFDGKYPVTVPSMDCQQLSILEKQPF